MQSQDAQTAVLLKVWPWIQTNKTRLIVITAVVVVVAFIYSYIVWNSDQKEIAAGQAVSQVASAASETAVPAQTAETYFKIANEYPGTIAGRRAWLQGASALFEAGQYPDAQTQFQKFLDAHPDGEFSAQATLGLAATYEALGNVEKAASEYQQVINGFSSDVVSGNMAKLALAQIDARQGKVADAQNLYDSIARTEVIGPFLQQQVQLARVELRTQAPATVVPAAKP